MLSRALRTWGWTQVVLAGLVLVVLACPIDQRRYGDRLQIALPSLAWACQIANRSGGEYFLRFAGMFVVAHGSKRLLGDAEVNRRPSGGDHGFPSAHTSSAAIGASSLVHDCLKSSPVVQALVIMSAAYVGASRIQAQAHDIWQVLAGGLLGWGADRCLRRDSPARRRVTRMIQITGQSILALFGWLMAMIRGVLRGHRGASHSPMRDGAVSVSPAVWRVGAMFAALVSLLVAVTLPAGAETEVSVYGGVQGAPHGSIRQTGMASQGVSWQGRSFEMPPYYGLRLTWWKTAAVGFGVELNHAKVYASDPASLGFDRLEFTDGLNIITLNAWRRWPGAMAGGRITPYVGAGVGLAVPHVDVQPAGAAHTFGYQVTGPAVQAVAGLSWRANDRWSVFTEYKGTYSMNRARLDSGGTLSTNILTNALNFGLSYRF